MDISIYDLYQLLLRVYSRQVLMAPGMVLSRMLIVQFPM